MTVHSKHLPAEMRRAVTVETVVTLAAEQNPSEITTTAIAKRMGVTQGALFKHFPTKDAILQAVMEWVTERLLSRMKEAQHSASSPTAAIEAIFMAHVEFVSEYPGVPRILFGELQRTELTASKRTVQSFIRRYSELLYRVIEDGKESGEFSVKVDTDAAITLLIGMIQGLVMQSLLADDVERIRREASRMFAIYRRGIGRHV